ncbi:MAG TPA: condensation domain-containing protein [Verrucomicrobiales bacterium]|nr:condensation domain-containing protein [Verrucomicrobiales bacterium]
MKPAAFGEMAETVAALGSEGGSQEEPRRVSRDRTFPLSPAQEGLWFLENLEPGAPAYLIPLVLRIRGPLDAGRLRQTLALLVERHEALRLQFGETLGTGWQRVSDPFEPELPVEEIGDESLGSSPNESLRAALRRETSRPLDLRSGRLLRSRLLRRNREEHFLALTLHHIAADGWSAGILNGDIARIYGALGATRETLPPAPHLQYVDYVLWQREQLEGGRLEELRRFWAGHLRGAPHRLDFRTDFSHPAQFRFRGGRFGKPLSAALTAALRELARGERATVSVVLASVFAILLHQGSGATDLLSGFPFANRTRMEWEQVVGYFANMSVRRTQLAGDPTFRELLIGQRDEAWETIDWLDIPFGELVTQECRTRDLSRHPLFQHAFSMQNLRAPKAAIPDLDIQMILADNGTSKFDFTLSAVEAERRIVLGLQYSTDLFRPETAHRILDHYERLLTVTVSGPALKLSQLPALR